MSLVRLIAILVGVALLAEGCGRKGRARRHADRERSPAVAALAPTPDTTPVEALRTPAGLFLKAGIGPTITPAPETPSPASGSVAR